MNEGMEKTEREKLNGLLESNKGLHEKLDRISKKLDRNLEFTAGFFVVFITVIVLMILFARF